MQNVDTFPKSLQAAILEIEKDFGQGAIFRLGDTGRLDIEVLPIEVLGIDRALGGGFPKGRIVEVYGPESSGKTTICLEAIACVQKKKGVAAFIDVEHALDPAYAKALGVDLNTLLVSQPSSGEEALNIMDKLCQAEIDLVVLDSVAALVTKSELNGDIGDAVVGAQARLMSGALRKLTSHISKSGTIGIFTNQIREKIGVMFGNPETTPGGKALKFYSSVRIDVRRTGALKTATGEVYGNKTKIKVVKNKVAAPFREAEFEIHFGKGVSRGASLIEEAVKAGIITKRGSWLEFEGNTFAQGLAAAIRAIEEDTNLHNKIYTKLQGETEAPANELEVRETPLIAESGKITNPPQIQTPIANPVSAQEPVAESTPLPPIRQTSEPTSDNAPSVASEEDDDDLPPVVEDEGQDKTKTEETNPKEENPKDEKLSIKQAIITLLTEKSPLTVKEVSEGIAPFFPDREIAKLKNQVGVTISNGVKQNIFRSLGDGTYTV